MRDTTDLVGYGIANFYLEEKPIDLGVIETSASRDLPAAVSYDSDSQPPGIDLTRLLVSPEELAHMHFLGGGEVSRMSPDGSFVIRKLTSDRYRLRVVRTPPGTYVKSATVGPTDVLRDPFTACGSPLRVVLGVDGGSVAGDVVDANGSPVSDIYVFLADSRDLTKTTVGELQFCVSDQNGHFAFRSGLRAGDYKLVAARGVTEDSGWLSPSMLSNGLDISIAPKERKVLRVTVMNEEEAKK